MPGDQLWERRKAGGPYPAPRRLPAAPTSPLWVCFPGHLGAGRDTGVPRPPTLFPVLGPQSPLFRVWVRPLPRPEVVLEVPQADRREVGAQPLSDPPFAGSSMRTPRETELVPVVLAPDPPAGRAGISLQPLAVETQPLRGPWGSESRVYTPGGDVCPSRCSWGGGAAHEEPPHNQAPDQRTWGQAGLQKR